MALHYHTSELPLDSSALCYMYNLQVSYRTCTTQPGVRLLCAYKPSVTAYGGRRSFLPAVARAMVATSAQAGAAAPGCALGSGLPALEDYRMRMCINVHTLTCQVCATVSTTVYIRVYWEAGCWRD